MFIRLPDNIQYMRRCISDYRITDSICDDVYRTTEKHTVHAMVYIATYRCIKLGGETDSAIR